MLNFLENELTLTNLQTLLHGELILPGDEGYESACGMWNGLVDHSPALIVRCREVDDVMEAVAFARAKGMTVAVRSGGHGLAAYGSNDGGMLIDLSHMKAITIDPELRLARLEPGLTWGEVAEALQPHGLALTSGDTASVGVGGLMLGGGIGWMVRKYGLALDHLRAVELVTADGQFLRASAAENTELFWGLRGGGGNFGIVTAFEVNLDPVGIILGGAVFYEATEAESILRAYASYAASAPDELTTMALLMAAPPAPFIPPSQQGTPVVAIAVCYVGDLTEGAQVVAPLRRLGTPVADVIGPMPYSGMFALTQEATVRGLRHAVRSMFFKRLNDVSIHTLVERAVPSISGEMLVQVRVLGGAMSRVPAGATAFAHRDKEALIMLTSFGPDEAGEEGRRASMELIWRALQPYGDGVYVNFLADDGPGRIHEAYPPETYARLVALKNCYDPTNFFQLNQNIMPTL